VRALVFDGEPALRDDWPVPRAGAGEALVAVRLAGVCKTDLEILKGYMGFTGVMGHEFVGQVAAGPPAWQGRRVVAEINCVCGRCDLCVAGLSNHCRNRSVIGIDAHDGVFAEYVAVPVRNLHAVPEGLSDEQAVFAEPLAAACEILHQVDLHETDRAVVLGDGRLGQLVARVLKGRTGELLLVGRHETKLEAAEKQGIQTRLAGQFVACADADLVVDATGSADGFELATAAVRPRGTIVLKSTFAAAGALDLAPIVIHEITVVGSRCGPFAEALDLLAAGEVDVSALLTGRCPLAAGLEAFEAARRPDSLKVLLDVR